MDVSPALDPAIPEPPRRSCLVLPPPGTSWLLWSLPSLAALAASGRRLRVITSDTDVSSLLKLSGFKPKPIGVRDVSPPLLRECDEAVILDPTLAAAWRAKQLRIPRRWGYRTGWLRRFLLQPGVPRPRDPARHASEYFRELMAALGAELTADVQPRLALSEKLHQQGRERLHRAQVPLTVPLVGVYTGNLEGGSGRPWPRQDWEELLRQLRRQHPGVRVILISTLLELWPTAVKVFEETGKIHPVVGPDLDPITLAAVLAQLRALIAADSSMLQLAAAVGVPCVGLFARNPARWAPRGEQHRIVVAPGSSLATLAGSAVLEAFASLRLGST